MKFNCNYLIIISKNEIELIPDKDMSCMYEIPPFE